MPSRVPIALQNVFVASQTGKEVNEAPRHGIGFKMFTRSFVRKLAGTGSSSKSKRNNASNNNIKKPVAAPAASTLNSERGAPTKTSVPTESITVVVRETAAEASRKAMKKTNGAHEKVIDVQSPQAFFDKALEERGYSTRKYCSLEGGYYCRPTPLQQASYGSTLSQAVRSSDATLLRRLLDSGLSPNPCNNFGESLVHMVCRRGDHKLLRILLESGCSLQVTDDYGRTPLHDACWKADPSFEVVQLILDTDKNLLNMKDCRGASPLSYVGKEKYELWINFLQSKMNRFWPSRDIATEGEERPPQLALRPPHSMPIPDPHNALSLELAAMVSNGRMQPEDVLYLGESSDDDSSSYDSEYSGSDASFSDDDSAYSDDYDSDDSEFDHEEMREICLRAGGPMAIAQCFTKKGGAGKQASSGKTQ